MSSIISIQRSTSKLAIMKGLQNTIQIGDQAFLREDLNPSLISFNQFWELMDTIKKHGYLRAAMSTVGRSAVGAWWKLRKHTEYGENAPELHRRRLYDFYTMKNRRWDNIKDFQNIGYKLLIGAMYLRYFGQAAYQIVRDENGRPVGLDFMHGFILPNVDKSGYFKSGEPAFFQFPSRNPAERVEYMSPRDVVFLVNPDWEGKPEGGSDVESLSSFALPIDIYLQIAAREYLKHRDKPEVVYELAPDISDEAFDTFVKEMEARRAGAANLGRNPIAVQGEFKVHELRPYPDALPYQESRRDTREEALAVTGVSGAKLGITESLASANVREMRREFHEASMVPLFRLIEVAFYEQIHVREFNAPGWEFKFNSPDFLNAVERATVHMRYRQIGVLNPNEIRYELGLPLRTDEQGDEYYDNLSGQGQQGSPPEGREGEPDAPGQIGEPTLDDQDPPRGDQHDENRNDRMLAELRLWRTVALRRMRKGKALRPFNSDVIPAEILDLVSLHLSGAGSYDEVAQVFDEVISVVEDEL